jgi:hypothetical protein
LSTFLVKSALRKGVFLHFSQKSPPNLLKINKREGRMTPMEVLGGAVAVQ